MGVKNKDFISLPNASKLIGKSWRTVRRWYHWYETFPVPWGVYLPPRFKVSQGGGTTYIKMSDLKHLKTFSENISLNGCWYGCMSEYNAIYQWKKKNRERALASKGLTYKDVIQTIKQEG